MAMRTCYFSPKSLETSKTGFQVILGGFHKQIRNYYLQSQIFVKCSQKTEYTLHVNRTCFHAFFEATKIEIPSNALSAVILG